MSTCYLPSRYGVFHTISHPILTINPGKMCQDSPAEVRKLRHQKVTSLTHSHPTYYMGAARRKPTLEDSVSPNLNLDSTWPSVVKSQIFTQAFEFLKVWFVVLAFKYQNSHFQRWPEISCWFQEGNKDKRLKNFQDWTHCVLWQTNLEV